MTGGVLRKNPIKSNKLIILKNDEIAIEGLINYLKLMHKLKLH